MGNQSSTEKKTQDHLNSLLDKWSIGERNYLEQYKTNNNSDISKLDIQKLLQQCQNNLPTYFDEQLTQIFSLYISQKGIPISSSTIAYYRFLEIINSFIDGTTLLNGTHLQPSEEFLALFTLANQQYNLSFKTFVSLIVKVGIRLWFSAGVNINEFDKKENEDNSTYEQQKMKLINTLLYSTGYLEQQKKKDNMDDWLQDNEDNNKDDNNNDSLNKSALDKWAEDINLSSFPFDENNKSYIMSWYNQTKGFTILFQLVAKCFFFSTDILNNNNGDGDQLHSLKIKHERSPYINDLLSSSLLTPYDYFYLSLQLPSNALSWSSVEREQHKVKEDVHHQRLYSSRQNGNSWQRFVQSIVQQGATLLLIKSKKDGSIFGGYTDEPWQLMTDWYGSSFNFLFQLSGHYSKWDMFGVWQATSNINDHYQYLCWGKKSLPNGLGMGGQFEYSGLWINADFIHGHSRGGPYCSTYQSPQLTNMDQFEIDEVEVWLVRPLLRDEEEELNGDSILNRNEDMEFLEMAGKKLYSRDLEKPENSNNSDDDDGDK